MSLNLSLMVYRVKGGGGESRPVTQYYLASNGRLLRDRLLCQVIREQTTVHRERRTPSVSETILTVSSYNHSRNVYTPPPTAVLWLTHFLCRPSSADTFCTCGCTSANAGQMLTACLADHALGSVLYQSKILNIRVVWCRPRKLMHFKN